MMEIHVPEEHDQFEEGELLHVHWLEGYPTREAVITFGVRVFTEFCNSTTCKNQVEGVEEDVTEE